MSDSFVVGLFNRVVDKLTSSEPTRHILHEHHTGHSTTVLKISYLPPIE